MFNNRFCLVSFRTTGAPVTRPAGPKLTAPTTKPTAWRLCPQVGNLPLPSCPAATPGDRQHAVTTDVRAFRGKGSLSHQSFAVLKARIFGRGRRGLERVQRLIVCDCPKEKARQMHPSCRACAPQSCVQEVHNIVFPQPKPPLNVVTRR